MAEGILKVGVVGAGSWGTALAQAVARAGHRALVLSRRNDVVEDINRHHRNHAYLGNRVLLDGVTATREGTEMGSCDLIILAVPAQATRSTLVSLVREFDAPLVLTAKGFEAASLKLQSDIVGECAPGAEVVVLSGPSFAADVAKGSPTAVTLAAGNADALDRASRALASASFRPYGSDDIIGVQAAGALKNVYALAAGAVEGAGLGLSARSALIARAMAELARLIAALGGKPATVNSLAGMGDLVLSCTSEQSRNYRFGLALGRGHKPDEIRAMGIGLAEGVFTAPAALQLAKNHLVDAPLVEAVNLVLMGRIDIGAVVDMLMTRPLKQEG
ncbi:MAG: NAD(P)-dependent glycerol-3-phosphate dehydrogenase [Hyphomicrobiaceae bacterium]|nr:NAD(P)-dependent glycerol-3-phosphate dehydrogenase [Hyphomicrobiaceae bacterium]